jgi:hypothetical protein
MAVLAGGVFLSFRSVDRIGLQQASYRIQADFRYAQRMAIIEGKRWGITFDIAENTYYVVSIDPRVIEKTVVLPGGAVLLDINRADVVYLPRGTVSSPFTLTLTKGGYQQQLTAMLGAGRIEIKEMKWID